jgi:plasmid stabilization system protein ParE
MRIRLSDEALADFEAATDWYLEELAFAAADDFADEFEHALALLGAFPEWALQANTKRARSLCPSFPTR